MMKRAILAIILAAFALATSGCVPAALEDATPDAAVLGVPANALLPGAAAGLDQRLRTLESGHDFVSANRLRFLEVRSGLVGSQARTGAARVARSSGAEVAVTISAATLVREVEDPDRAPAELLVLQVDVALIRASDATELARLSGPRLSGRRSLATPVLRPLDDDPLLHELLRASLDDLAPRVAAELRFIALSGSSAE